MSFTVMDYDVLWSNDFIGEAYVPLQQARPISMMQSVDQCPVIMVAVKRPHTVDGGAFEVPYFFPIVSLPFCSNI